MMLADNANLKSSKKNDDKLFFPTRLICFLFFFVFEGTTAPPLGLGE